MAKGVSDRATLSRVGHVYRGSEAGNGGAGEKEYHARPVTCRPLGLGSREHASLRRRKAWLCAEQGSVFPSSGFHDRITSLLNIWHPSTLQCGTSLRSTFPSLTSTPLFALALCWNQCKKTLREAHCRIGFAIHPCCSPNLTLPSGPLRLRLSISFGPRQCTTLRVYKSVSQFSACHHGHQSRLLFTRHKTLS